MLNQPYSKPLPEIFNALDFQKGPLDATYDDFLVDLKAKDGSEDDCRYAIYDYHYFVNTQGTSEPSARLVHFFAVLACRAL